VNRGTVDEAGRWIDENKDIKIHIDRTFSLDEASKAFDYQKDVHTRGKVVLSL
jgi:NADPH:quinone reductase-like Zn-dependent oxidoreductase